MKKISTATATGNAQKKKETECVTKCTDSYTKTNLTSNKFPSVHQVRAVTVITAAADVCASHVKIFISPKT